MDKRAPIRLTAIAFTLCLLTLSAPAFAGGSNTAHITRVYGRGYMHVVKDSSKVGFHIQGVKNVQVDAQVACRFSGYRARGLNEHNFPAKSVVAKKRLAPRILADVPANSSNGVGLNLQRAKPSSTAAIRRACEQGKSYAQVPIYVRGWCKRTKGLIGKKNYYTYAQGSAPFLLKCTGFTDDKKRTLTLYYSARYRDYWTNGLPGGKRYYTRRDVQGFTFLKKKPGTLEIKEYIDKKTQDHIATTKKPPSGYSFSRSLGYIYKNHKPGTRAIKLYYNSTLRDYLTISKAASERFAKRNGYKFKGVLGYVLDP